MTERAATASCLDVRLIQVEHRAGESASDRLARVTQLVQRQDGADLVLLPELWHVGYFHFGDWASSAESVNGPTVAALALAAREIGATVHIGSIVEGGEGKRGHRGLWNTSVVLDATGSVLATYRKIHRFGFAQGEAALVEAGSGAATFPVRTHDAVEAQVGLAICYDLRFPELFRSLTAAGSTMFAVAAAWPAERREHWTVLGRARALENQCFLLQCNTAGVDNGTVMGGHSQIVAPWGEVIAAAGDGEEVLRAQLSLAELAEYRRSFPVLADRVL